MLWTYMCFDWVSYWLCLLMYSCLSIITIATPLSAVWNMWSLSFLSSLIAKCSALVRLGLGGWEALSTQFILALSSSTSCWRSLVKAASMAVMYSKLRGCFGETRKLGPLASTDLCALVKGLLDKLITHFGLSSSKEEEPWRLLYILGRGEDLASWKTLAWEDAAWETLLSCWEIVLSTLGVLPSCLEELLGVWPACLDELGVLPAWELLLGEACEALRLAEHLTAGIAWGRTALSVWERMLFAGEAWELPAWETVLSAWGSVLSAWEDWELLAWEIALSAWERVLSAGEAWETALSAWERVLSTGKPGNWLPEKFEGKA